jgi:hypothetical protein
MLHATLNTGLYEEPTHRRTGSPHITAALQVRDLARLQTLTCVLNTRRWRPRPPPAPALGLRLLLRETKRVICRALVVLRVLHATLLPALLLCMAAAAVLVLRVLLVLRQVTAAGSGAGAAVSQAAVLVVEQV